MKHKITLKIKNIESPIEIDVEENTFNQISKFCQEKYPDKDWEIISNS